jgi:hypothetical protein
MPTRFRLSDELRGVLEGCGLPWALQPGKRHVKLTVGGRLAAVLPKVRGHDSGSTPDNVLAAVRRLVRELTGAQP